MNQKYPLKTNGPENAYMKLGTLCYIRDGNKTLLMHRTKKEKDEMKGCWIGLGGKIDPGESPHECVTREAYEESGFKITPVLRGIATFANLEPHKHDWYAYIFTADSYSGTLKQTREGDLHWVDDKKLKEINILEGDRLFIDRLINSNDFFAAKFVYKDDTLTDHSFYES